VYKLSILPLPVTAVQHLLIPEKGESEKKFASVQLIDLLGCEKFH
jgi:hypothetical protein